MVNSVSVNDILSGSASMPFLNKTAWRSAQHADGDLRRVYAHITQGTRPSKKSKNLRHLRRYLNVATVDDNGLIIVKKQDPGHPARSLIVVPTDILPGIVTALHLSFKHATKHQLKLVFSRYYFGIKSSEVISNVVDHCEFCNSIKCVPAEIFDQSLTLSQSAPGCVFFADVLRRCRQKICVVRDVHSSYTTASIIPDETGSSLKTALLMNTAFLRGPKCVLRIDTATGFQSIRHDTSLQEYGIDLDFGYTKNKNSNCVVDKGIQELEAEFLKIGCSNVPISDVQLHAALDVLNSRVRNRGLSAKEIVFQRDQHSLEQLGFNDKDLAEQQNNIRLQNHPSSAQSKAPGKGKASVTNSAVGSLVFIKDERDKNKVRDRYIIVAVDKGYATVQKLTDKFMSKKYTVPLNRLYPASNTAPALSAPLPSDDDDDSDDDYMHTTEHQPDIADISEEDEEDEEDADDDNGQVAPGENQVAARRHPRDRQQPTWMRSGEFVLE